MNHSSGRKFDLRGGIATLFRGHPMLKKTVIASAIVIGVPYLFFALVIMNLDGDTVRERIIALAGERAGVALSIGELRLSFPFTVKLSDVEISFPDNGAQLKLASATASIPVWKLLFISPHLSLAANVGQGNGAMDISANPFSRMVRIELSAEALPLDQIIVSAGGTVFPLKANINGKATFIVPPLSPTATTGNADFSLSNLAFKEGSPWASFLAGFTPQSGRCVISIMDKKLFTRQCGISSPVGNAELRASATLMDQISSSPLEGAFVFHPGSGRLSETIGMLYIKFRKADGNYYFPVTGTLGVPAINVK